MKNGEDWTGSTYDAAERAIGYRFHDRELLKTCFTHSTYRNNVAHGGADNERLEFLGDAVLQLVISDYLFRTSGSDEGKLTERRKGYVSKEALTPVAERLGLMKFLRHSNREEDMGGKNGKILSSLVEAVTAGIYLDGGMAAAEAFLRRNLEYMDMESPISALQVYVQDRTRSTPVYHDREDGGEFEAEVLALGARGTGRGKSKQAAKEAAAKMLLQKLKERESH